MIALQMLILEKLPESEKVTRLEQCPSPHFSPLNIKQYLAIRHPNQDPPQPAELSDLRSPVERLTWGILHNFPEIQTHPLVISWFITKFGYRAALATLAQDDSYEDSSTSTSGADFVNAIYFDVAVSFMYNMEPIASAAQVQGHSRPNIRPKIVDGPSDPSSPSLKEVQLDLEAVQRMQEGQRSS
ncbi:uncharacterized protein LOC127264716 [Andrographis paniculata]|uniref:uncharacterized protein LOC127264716 n=1 Tax=Andrographis paniculata TaxID=175694 RepID=UPI0021E9131F|nr:uncharacterized protein LOC127264716 [Andrographis paniculata]